MVSADELTDVDPTFVFAYQALHHFAQPVPVIAECHRVLGQGGHLFFNEEPMDSPLRRMLRMS